MSHKDWWRQYPLQVNPGEVGSISISEAHIWWTFGKESDVKIFRFLSNEDIVFAQEERRGFTTEDGYQCWSDVGACFTDWSTRKKSMLVRECTEMMLELMVRGIDPIKIVREFSKIRELVLEGSKSYYMARVFSVALQGKAIDLPEQWNLAD